eukprot:2136868-Rhodomonas_salina.1
MVQLRGQVLGQVTEHVIWARRKRGGYLGLFDRVGNELGQTGGDRVRWGCNKVGNEEVLWGR